jgi:ubiquinone/menaquinone biosynthesis C-methylase UbiE
MDDWRSYDGVAEAYERANGVRLGAVARELLALAAPLPERARVLDVGTGTGVTASEASASGGGLVIGIDRSLEMLRVGRAHRDGFRPVAAEAIDIPFRDDAFDLVTATFVLNHFTRYETALFDMIRVLRQGGRLALATWAGGVDDLQRTWRELIESVVQEELLDDITRQAIPWEDRFADRGRLEEALMAAGLQHVRTEPAQYHLTMTLDEYLDGREASASGRFARSMLGDGGWAEFRTRARGVYAERFSDPLNDFRDVILAVASKPGA